MDSNGDTIQEVNLQNTEYNKEGSTDDLSREKLLKLFEPENVTRTQSAPVRGSVEGSTELESTQSAPAVVEGKTTEVSADVSLKTPSSSGDSGPKIYKATKDFNTTEFEAVKFGDIFTCNEKQFCEDESGNKKDFLLLTKGNTSGWVKKDHVDLV